MCINETFISVETTSVEVRENPVLMPGCKGCDWDNGLISTDNRVHYDFSGRRIERPKQGEIDRYNTFSIPPRSVGNNLNT